MPPGLPLERLNCAGYFLLGVGFGLLAKWTGRIMAEQDVVMRATGGVGNLAFQLLGSWRKADPVLAAWRAAPKGKAAARTALLVDFAFIAGYAGLGLTVASAAAERMAARGWSGWSGAARWSGWALLVAGLLDVVENLMLFRVLAEDRGTDWPRYAAWFAKAKWALAILAVIAVTTVGAAILGRPVAG